MTILRRCGVTAGALLVLAAGLAQSVPPAAAQAQAQAKTLTVTPDEGLANGDTVNVSVAGAAPGELLVLFQCNRPDPPEKTAPAPNALNHCLFAAGTYKTANADASGALETTFDVAHGTFTSLGNTVEMGDTSYLFVTNTTETFADAPPSAELTFGEPAGPTATATPSEGLEDGDVVTIEWSGYPADAAVAVTQCTGTVDPTDAGACDLNTFVQGMSDANGAGSLQFTVHTGAIGDGGGTCDTDHQCVVLVADFGGLARSVSVLTFAGDAPPPTDPTTTTTNPVTTPTTAGTTPTTGGPGVTGDELPRTGSGTGTMAAAGVAALATGGALVWTSRRRRRSVAQGPGTA